MGAATYVGRVGGLAVALGVGAAVVTGQAVAFAETGSNPPNSDSSQGPAAGDPVSDEKGTPDSTVAKPSGGGPPPGNSTTIAESDVPAVPGQAVSSGGGLISQRAADDKAGSAKAEEGEPDIITAEPDDIDAGPETDPPPAPKRTKRHAMPTAKRSPDRSLAKPAEITLDRLTAPATARSVVSSIAKAVDITPVSSGPVQRTALSVPTTFATQSSFTTARESASAVTAAPPASTVKSVVTRLLSAFGIGPSAANIPGVPAFSAALAMLAYGARREVEPASAAKSVTASSTPVAALALTGASTAAVAAAAPDRATTWTVTPVAVSANTDRIENLTGPGKLNDTENRFGIGGTDVGVMWDNGIPDNPATPDVNEHQVLIAFGDTFRDDVPVRTTGWRMNTLLRSWDNTLSNGMYVRDAIPHDPGTFSGTPESNPNYSREIIGKPPYAVGPEVTIIPTAAISVPYDNAYGSRQYIQFMSVRSWDTPGQWTTNYSGIAYSDDNGQNWRSELVPASAVRTAAAGRSTVPYVAGNENFQQGAFLKPKPGSPEAAAGYVYAYGTPAGRNGTVYLSRVKQDQILDTTKYEYWNGTSWTLNKPSAAKPILPGTTTTSFFGLIKNTTYPSAGEMSVQYNEYEQKYIMLYTDKNNNVVMRKADTPQGTWSAPTTLVTSTKMPGLYAPMIHPWSSTTNVPDADRKYLYWNLSTWNDYEVKTMRTDLSKV